MNKAELVEEVYSKNNCTKKECREVLDSILDTIVKEVQEGESVRLVNFGTFEPSPRKSTVRRHPQTGKKIEVDSKVVPGFRPGKGFREKLEDSLEAVKDQSGDLNVEKA